MKAFLREPLLHFLVGGAVILLAFNVLSDAPPPVSDRVLEITDQDLTRVTARFEATWRRPPTDQEMGRLVEQLVRQEVLVREALALGLDRGDEIVRQRLVQKMTFLVEGSVSAMDPTDDVLEQHLRENADRFERPASIAFSQVLLRDGVDLGDVIAALTQGENPELLVNPTLLPDRFPLTRQPVIDRTFGIGFFDALTKVEPETWSGTVESAYGRHVVFVEAYVPASIPELAKVREAVTVDWRSQRESALLEARITALLSRYEVILPEELRGAAE